MEIERRAVEFRAEAGGVLSGVLIPYGVASDIGGIFRETFRPGSMRWRDLICNVQHDRARPVARLGSGLVLTDSPEALRAAVTLPETQDGRDVLTLARGKILRGFSAEFRAIKDSWQETAGAVPSRTVREAELLALAIVDDPAHELAVLDEIRARIEKSDLTLGRNRKRWWF